MKLILIYILVFAFSGILNAQSPSALSKKEQRQMLKEERQRQRAIDLERSTKLVDIMANSGQFVLEADMIFDRRGSSAVVQPQLNFVACDSLYGVIQVGNAMYVGGNGLGGFTITGKISNYEVKKNEKRGNYIINFTIASTYGPFDVNMNASPSGSADATVRGTFSGSIRYSGDLVFPTESKIYQGYSR